MGSLDSPGSLYLSVLSSMLNFFQILTTICQILMVKSEPMRGVIRRGTRGSALLFTVSGLIVTVMAMRSRSYRKSSELSEILDG